MHGTHGTLIFITPKRLADSGERYTKYSDGRKRMNKLNIAFADALKIVEAQDKAYADEIKTLIQMLKRNKLDSWKPAIGDIPAERENDYVASLYRKQVIERAREYINAEFLVYMKTAHPDVSIET